MTERKDLHEHYGGSRQGGISTSTVSPNVLNPASEHSHGYDDRRDGPLLLWERVSAATSGTKGNKAILQHRETGRALQIFKEAGDDVRYLGEKGG